MSSKLLSTLGFTKRVTPWVAPAVLMFTTALLVASPLALPAQEQVDFSPPAESVGASSTVSDRNEQDASTLEGAQVKKENADEFDSPLDLLNLGLGAIFVIGLLVGAPAALGGLVLLFVRERRKLGVILLLCGGALLFLAFISPILPWVFLMFR